MDTSVAEESIPTYEEVCWKSKPYRTMTYPPRTQSHHHHPIPAPRTRSKKGAPLDPYDLSRRLRAHLAQQKALAEHRRASLSSTSTDPYHHTPQVAALSFEHTATAEKLRNVHKLSEPALKNLGYMTIDAGGGGLGGCGSGYAYQKPGTLLQKTQIYDHVTADKAKVRNRNQYQWTSALERAAELDAERDVYRCPRRTFNSDVPVVHKSRAGMRPMSMGDYLPWEEKEEREVKEVKREKNDRHDWTQRDESEETRRSMRERVGPLLSLKLKKGKGLEEGEGGRTKSLVRSPIRVSFFGRFKRSSPSHGW
ncbi:hypothetical protein BCIN_14g04740 [Botrytis cinerea B05.10]|uniref:Uncharacterized protein n=1 Tax=Botryotinia fuckeliana (strain B05.10) TaxID=332648 RepID=A0A384K3W3_BOTFB|nr:hypothetical protein BCIN_14g04740 [Botrytis cinerea B05.10]ATZ57324.1 hypothetical protein BCIN_14g04740 [Botrytis cinerea B05.10]